MTLLTICQSILDEVGIDDLSSVVGNTERAAKTLLAAANESGKRLAKKPWEVLAKEHAFSTVASTASYALPSDFGSIIGDTAWDRTNYWRMRGGLTPNEWQVRKSAIIATTATRKMFRIRPDSNAKKIFLDPTPTAVESLVFEYRSTHWCQSAGGSGQDAWAADTDTGILDEDLLRLDLLWRYLRRRSMSYADERRDAELAVDEALSQELGRRLSPHEPAVIGAFNLPEAGFGS